jgi:hypothetical protein
MRARVAAFATAGGLIAVVGIGAAHDRGVTAHVAPGTGSVGAGSATSP